MSSLRGSLVGLALRALAGCRGAAPGSCHAGSVWVDAQLSASNVCVPVQRYTDSVHAALRAAIDSLRPAREVRP